MVNLKPCPFCGCSGINLAFPRLVDGRMSAVVECFTDGCYAKITADTEAEAVSAWNRRAHNSDSAEPVAWRVSQDGGVTIWNVESNANSNAKLTAGVIEPLYLASPPEKEVTRPMIVAAMQEFNELTDRYISDDAMRRILIKALTNRTPDEEVGNG